MLKRNIKIIAFLIFVVMCTIFIYYYHVQTTWVDSKLYERIKTSPANVLVVVYSRTGNTAGVATTIARHFDADILPIKAPQYGLTTEGQMLASRDADEEVTTTHIEHNPVDLSKYDLIFLCSPTWWFRPAVPLWAFVENHDFADKPVFLTMTGNSRYKTELTDKFATLVSRQNGELLDTLFIRRGRIYWQKTPAEVSLEMKNALQERKHLWEKYIGS